MPSSGEPAAAAQEAVLELRAERELGDCLLAAGQAEEALSTFMSFLSLARQASSPRDIVTAHLKLAQCYNRFTHPMLRIRDR